MNQKINERRRFIKTSIVVPMLGVMPWKLSYAAVVSNNNFPVPDNIHSELIKIYGESANTIVSSDKLKLKTPDIAENGAVVSVTVKVEKGLASSMSIFVAGNPKPLASTSTFHEGSDLFVSLRVKVGRSSDLYAIAQTKNGLIGVKNHVKVTIGCGGG